MCPAQCCRRHFRQANGFDLSFAHLVGQCASAFFDGHLLLPAVQVIQIDDLGAQAPEAFVTGTFEGLEPSVDHPLAVDGGNSALAGQYKPETVAAEYAPDQFFIGTESI